METKTFKGVCQARAWNNQSGKENSVQFLLSDSIAVLVSNSIVQNVVFGTIGTHLSIPVIISKKLNVDIEYAQHKKDEEWENPKTGIKGKYTNDGYHVVKLRGLTLCDQVIDKIIDSELRRGYVNPNVITLEDDPMKS